MYPCKTLPTTWREVDRKIKDQKYHGLREHFGRAIGRAAVREGPSEAARQMNVSRDTARYWQEKVLNAQYHPGAWGGRREEQMAFGGIENDETAQTIVYLAILERPTASFKELLARCRSVPGLEAMSAAWLSRTISSWGWDWAKARLIAKHKYTDQNIQDYVDFTLGILDFPLASVSCSSLLVPLFSLFLRVTPPIQLIFVDEAHFVGSKLGRPRLVGPEGTERVLVDHRPNEPRLNAILMTSLAHPNEPVYVKITAETVTAERFQIFLAEAALANRIPKGAVVIWDNARVHLSRDGIAVLDRIMASVGAQRANLPKYSPELNPCELVFAEVKTFLRHNPRLGWNLT